MQVPNKAKSSDDKNQISTAKHPETMLEVLNLIYKKEGISGFFNGLGVGVLQVVASNFAYFYSYTAIRNKYLNRLKVDDKIMHKTLSVPAELLIGAVAGIWSQIVSLPISVAVTRQQTTDAEHRKSMLGTWEEIIKEDGVTGLWSGLKPSFLLVINPSITYAVFEKLKAFWLNTYKHKSLTALQIFVIGAIAKSVATVVTYPLIMAKVRLQWKPSKTDGQVLDQDYQPYKSSLDVLKRVYKREGFQGWYKGMQAQISKAVLSQALLFLFKEEINYFIVILMAIVRQKLGVQKKAA